MFSLEDMNVFENMSMTSHGPCESLLGPLMGRTVALYFNHAK